MSLKAQRKIAVEAAQAIIDGAKKDVRSLTDEEKATVDNMIAEVKAIDEKLKQKAADDARMAAVGALFGSSDDPKEPGEKSTSSTTVTERDPYMGAKSVGELVVKTIQAKGLDLRNPSHHLETPEMKAATDTHMVGNPVGGFYEPWLVDYQKDNPVRQPREKPVVADLISWSTTTASAIKYIEYPTVMLEGSAGMVLEGGTKPQVHVGEPFTRLDALSEIAAWFKLTDDVLEDLPRMVTEINNELRENFANVEAEQLLRGNGTAPNLRGILNRSGVQTLSVESAEPEVLVDGILQASKNIQTVTGLRADGVVIHPDDYFKIRTMKDANGQYFAGGPFNTNYGQSGLAWDLPIWGLPTVVTTTATMGQPIVANWKSATAYRKGGLKIESTNSHVDDFTNDRVTIRWRTKLGLAVRRPAAFVQIKPA